ncbi:MAG: hypothetical protein AAGF11_40805 [Myxococcota bacterium]
MKLSGFSRTDAALVLGGAAAIVSAGGHCALQPLERRTLDALRTRILDPALGSSTPKPRMPDEADLLGLRERLDHALLDTVTTLWCLMPIVEGTLRPHKVAVLNALLAALGRGQALGRDLEALAAGKRLGPKLRIFRRALDRAFGQGFVRTAGQLSIAALGLRDRAIGRRYDTLRALPQHTYGYQLWSFYHQNAMTMPGRWGAYPYEQIGPHDSHHVLAGCDTSYHGEFLVLPFVAGSSHIPSADFLATMMLQAHAGMVLDPNVRPTRGLFRPDPFFRELVRGSRVRVDLLAPQWDLWAYVDRPLAEVRAKLGVGPGGNTDPHHPRWNGKDTPENQALARGEPVSVLSA